MTEKILVTGATGFVGQALCRRLEEDGYSVIKAVRSTTGNGTEIVVGDLTDKTDWSDTLKNVTTVIHLAARVHIMEDASADPLAAFRAVNRDATKHLAEQAAETGVKRFIYLSSVKAAGEESFDRPLKETDPAQPLDPYGQSKREAEQVLQAIAEETSMAVTVLRPPLVYGPGVKGNFLTLLKVCRKTLPLPLGAIDNRRSLVFLDNLVDAIARAATVGKSGFSLYYVADEQPVSTPELIRAVGTALGKPPRLLPIPAPLLSLLGRMTGKSAAVSRLTGSLEVDTGLIRQELGWTPPYSLEQGLTKTAVWFLAKNP